MSTVETVLGRVELAQLGPTLMHEHVFVLDPEALQNDGHAWGGASYWDEDAGVAEAIGKLQRLKDGGIHTIVDPTAPGLGRHIPRMFGNPTFADEHADYLHISTKVLPALLAAGVPQAQIDQMLVGEPAAVLRTALADTSIAGILTS